MKWTTLLLAFLLALVAGGAPADAKGKKGKKPAKEEPAPVEVKPVWPSPLDPGLLDPMFKELPFGKERSVFVTSLQIHFEEQLKPVLRATLDARERDVLKGKMDKAFLDVENSYVEFVGQKTGYAVSVVEGEFRDNAGEGLMKYPYGDDTAYFFFSGGAFWKMILCTQQTPDFPSLLVKLATLYGDPKTLVHSDKEKTIPVEATWEDTTFRVVASAPKGIFVCSRLSWTYLPQLPAVEQLRTAAAASQGKPNEADQILLQVTQEPEKDESDVLDRILKKKKEQKGE